MRFARRCVSRLPIPCDTIKGITLIANSQMRHLRKHLTTLAGLALALAFVILFFQGRPASKPLQVVATRLGLSEDELMAMGPRIASQTGATVGTSRRVVYLLACSGVPTRVNLEAQATLAADIAEKQRVTPREAATTVLSSMPTTDAAEALRDC